MKQRVRSFTKMKKGTYLTNTYSSLGEYAILRFFTIMILLPFYLLYWFFKYSIIGIKKLIESVNKNNDRN